MEQISDRQARDLAETTFDRNVVVVAGAGTGKTTLLVNRLVHLLVKEPDPIPLTQIVALTFTNKTSTEMKVRLRERLSALTQSEEGETQPTDGGAVSVGALRDRYGLSTGEIAARAAAALRDLEKAQIGTLHSFAAHLLRLYPLESGVDPAFKEDDGLRFEEHFTQAWDLWIDAELGREGSHHHTWRSVLRIATLEELRALTFSLCSELVELDDVRQQIESSSVHPVLREWWRSAADQGQALLDTHDRPKRRKVEQALAAAVSFLRRLAEQGISAVHEMAPSNRDLLSKDLDSAVAGWDKKDFKAASRCIASAKELLGVDHEFFNSLLSLVSSLVLGIRASFSHKGWLSFDGLLARARRLLRDHPTVRERIKQEYRAVLVDEFQDTDPAQYDIILAVSERHGSHATNWQETSLEPGKLFIVGDPKQSIYAFRRADIEAFDRVVQKIESERGMIQILTTNFRSNAAVLGPVNETFDRLFQPQPLVQPANVRLIVRPQRRPSTIESGVRLHMTVPNDDGEPFDAAGATRAESEALARWLQEDLLRRSSIKPGHVALLFRKLTQADTYLDALRRYGIPYVIEGEKHFYRRQEVIDFVNVLRVLDHPHDAVALAGLLRSPIGGLNDRDLYDLRSAGQFDYLRGERLESWEHVRASSVRRLYGHLAWLHRNIATLPLSDAMQLIFDRLPVLELAAASLHGEQAVANLLKVKQTAIALSDRPNLTMSGFVDLMVSRLEEQPDEAESPLAEESSEAVQVLTIHKAKGLEFPVVVLPGLHQGTGPKRSAPNVTLDWSSGIYGLSLGNCRTVGSVLNQGKVAMREEAEGRRVLYVGMTRAKELLVLSGGMTAWSRGESVLGLLQDIGEGEIGSPATTALMIGDGAISHQVTAAPDRKRSRRSLARADERASIDPASVAQQWNLRTVRWAMARTKPLQLTPSALFPHEPPMPSHSLGSGEDRRNSRLVGVLAHRLLEQWDFSADKDQSLQAIPSLVTRAVSPGQLASDPSLIASLHELFSVFTRSEAYSDLCSATILGREVPFLIPWGDGQVLDGVIDLVYRRNGRICIADYKTDWVTKEEAHARAEQYRPQLSCYRSAVMRSLGAPSVWCEVVFLRPGVAISLGAE